MFIVDKHNK